MSNIDKPFKANSFTRRNFLFGATKSLAKLAVASAGVYAIGSAFKSLDGSMVAGAKFCTCNCRQSSMCGGPNSMFDELCDVNEPWVTHCPSLNGTCWGTYYLTHCASY
jgi:hypothetical protein